MAAPHAQLIPSSHTFLLYDEPVEMDPEEPDPPEEKSLEYLKVWNEHLYYTMQLCLVYVRNFIRECLQLQFISNVWIFTLHLQFWLFRTSDMRFIPDPRLTDYVSEYKKCKRKEAPPLKNTRTFLESLFPTKYWTDNGRRFKQLVPDFEIIFAHKLFERNHLQTYILGLHRSSNPSSVN